MTIKYVSDGATGEWGAGLGRPLFVEEADQNIWQLVQAIDAAAAAAGSPVGIASIAVSGAEMTITLTDATVLGPFTLPTSRWTYRGAWAAATAYSRNDVVKVANQGIYLVQVTHTSAATFDDTLESAGTLVYAPIMPAAEQARQVTQDVTGTTFTPDTSYLNKLIRCTNDSGCLVTIPKDVFSVDDELYFLQEGDSVITFDDGVGVTFAPNDLRGLSTLGRGSMVMFKMVSANTWLRAGDLATPSTATL